MKRGYYRSRSKSYERRKSKSRSREKNSKRSYTHKDGSTRDNSYRVRFSGVQSDIKNHFTFKLPNLSHKQEQDTVTSLKSTLNQHFGPVEHITPSKQPMQFNLGFKYDVDAMRFLEARKLTIKLPSTQKIQLRPIPTKVFTKIINQRSDSIKQQRRERGQYQKHSKRRSRSRSYPSQSSSVNASQDSKNRKKQNYIKIQVYGIPSYLSEEKSVTLLSQSQGGPYKVYRSEWKQINQTSCEYLEIRMEPDKADKILDFANKIQIDGKPVVMIEESQRPTRQLLNYQFQIQFPKAVHPSKVLKYLQFHAKVVQMVACQQFQQDGKCKGFIITLNDRAIASSLKKLGELSCGIKVCQPKQGLCVYRPHLNRNQ